MLISLLQRVMPFRRRLAWSAILGMFVGAILVNSFAYELEQFNSVSRVFLRNGTTSLRSFNTEGLPVSQDPRQQREFISPFYVVHYGLIHSKTCPQFGEASSYHWKNDSTEKYWNAPPKTLSSDIFRISADWVVNNIARDDNGNAHLFYEFDWPYANLNGAPLTAPWWSGLTDAVAILLMLRAHDCLGGDKYLDSARDLYDSVVTPFADGGSLTRLNGLPWVEEYADDHIAENDLSRVLNGMVYAYHGIRALEEREQVARYAPSFRAAIYKNADLFSKGYWSYYDNIGNASNIKYHAINLALLKDPRIAEEASMQVEKKWAIGHRFPIVFYLLEGPLSVAKIHFALISVLIISLCGLVASVGFHVLQRKKSR
ncbi:hypothetical protein B7H23_14630 [Notoacmeibacter marinus]|uniref:D-glucuronyl C5-epimerase C-terminal domain-containing protein n=1 Tax=Notoacmeibacter marinus TaxID=1876515 RepID=A0A231UU11_9HYPH|nr:D-glucuronyl C5-epimerase family protein [Notoacmeibacter marinus]OXS99393.1 hypothetical protein B7H23_14630 [Notoacmeibacter marinus]